MKEWEKDLKIDAWTSQYKSVDLFLKHYSRKVRSERTRENISFTLKRYCKYMGKSPDDLVKQTKAQASKTVQEYIDSLANEGKSIRYVNVILAFLKTYYKVNGFKGSRALEVERHYQPSRYMKRSEYIPTSAEIYNMALASGSKRNRALIISLYTSGLRNSTLRALLYGDVKEELLSDKEVVKFPVYPEMKNVDEAACKGNIPYYTFISKDAVEALKEYIEQRTQEEGKREDDELLFSSEAHSVSIEARSRTPVMLKSLDAMVKTAAQKARIERWKDVYPHTLRKAFESALRNAGLDPKDQEFLMGHILQGTQDVYYDKTKTEELRQKYARVNFFPEKTGFTEDTRKKQILDMVKIFGYSEDRIKKIEDVLAKHRTVDEAIDEFRKLKVEEAEEEDRSERKRKTMHDGNGKYLIAHTENELIERLNDGCKLIQSLGSERFLLEN